MVRVKHVLVAVLIATAGMAAAAGPLTPAASAQATKTGPLCSVPYLVQHANWEFCWQLDELRVQGLELNDMKWNGDRVMWKAGVPFSITRYHLNQYGPYKDAFGNAGAGGHPGYGRGALPITDAMCPRWLAEGTVIGNGKVCLETSGGVNPRVAVWSRFDAYNYRFANGWILHADGTIEPKVMLGGLLIDGNGFNCQQGGSGCVTHFHHVYWRFDFDIAGEGGDTIQEYHRSESSAVGTRVLDPVCSPVQTGGPWCSLTAEGARVRDYVTFTKWRAADYSAPGNQYGHARSFELHPAGMGPGDGVSTFDLWAFGYKGDSREIGYEVPTNPYTDAYLARYVNGDLVQDTDNVMWYVEHALHEPRDEEKPTMMWHSLGPTIKPRNFVDRNIAEVTYP